ncbi:hypothetical protein BPAE_0155g00260 [Botrytis paeoniae]|uniref:Uncharacterized protein n=1 Tax=Botrytis paeoniae TaxID=278948 RepID=A0A4Z1FHM6_9HELO|nr:hypothetical protein BPAE_0155g00260 [Botrytis paeoniae]
MLASTPRRYPCSQREIHNGVDIGDHIDQVGFAIINDSTMETLAPYAQAMAGRPSSDDSVEIGAAIEAPALSQSEGIYFRSVDCRKRFEHSIQILRKISSSEALNQQFDRSSSLFTIQDKFAHYKAWGNSIAAFQDVLIRTLLEFRLKEATEIQ